MSDEVRWERLLPHQLEARFAEYPLVYFTYGLCEPHGPHNAVGLDGLKAAAIAIRAAQRGGGIVAPPDWWHVHEVGPFAEWAVPTIGEVPRTWLTAVPPWIHFKNVCYQLRAAEQIGFKAAILLTGHYGPNWRDLKWLVDLIQPHLEMQVYALPDFEANEAGFDGEQGDHAGRVETSLLLSTHPECVDLSRLPTTASDGGTVADSSDELHLSSPPYFAMGPTASEANQAVGDRMVEDEIGWLVAKGRELLSSGGHAPGPRVRSFADIERFWAEEVAPVLFEFHSMASPAEGAVAPESRWSQNADPLQFYMF